MSDYSEFFLNTPSSVAQLDLVEISHPNFTQVYRVCPQFNRNEDDGHWTVDLSGAETGIDFIYAPMRVQSPGVRSDLDFTVSIDFGDLGEILPAELDAVQEASGFRIKPTIRMWTFRSDSLGAPIYGPLTLEIPSFSFTQQGATFEARAPTLNTTRTGERYKLARFSPLRGFL